MKDFEPKIVCFLLQMVYLFRCRSRRYITNEISANGVVIKTLCSSRVDPQHVLLAFSKGCDGVFIGGCHPGDCHYQSGNYKTKRRVILLKKVLEQLGLNSNRLRLEWISASEGKKFANTMKEFTDQVKN